MFLTDEEKRMFQGEYGQGIQKAISLLIKFGELFGADKLIKVTGCHISPDVPDRLLEKYTEGVDKAKPSMLSMHPTLYPQTAEKIIGRSLTPDDYMAEGYIMLDQEIYTQRMKKFARLGFLPTSTCVPFLTGFVQRPKDVFSLTGSSGQVICNSIFGGRANRDGHSSALASAVTGRTPNWGLMKPENRSAEIVIRVEQLKLSSFNLGDFGALGYYIGDMAGTRNVVIDGLPDNISMEQLKYLLSPMSVSGGTVMCHIVGVTPEAPTLTQALGGKSPEKFMNIQVTKNNIEESYAKLNSTNSNQIDLVILGCPHLTINEIKNIASFLQGKKIKDSLRLLIGTAKSIYTLAKTAGFVDIIEQAGGEFLDICISTGNPLIYLTGMKVKVVMTDSARAAHYIHHISKGKVQTVFADTTACLLTATRKRGKTK